MDLHECCRRVVVPPLCGPPTVSLALLLDFAIHQTIHELQVLSELNLKKKPEDRKISVVQFAHSTRLIFVRLLAIVRWLKSNRKFEPLSSIRFLLDEQAARYVETADKLVEIARNELPNARFIPFYELTRKFRLSVFHVPQAVDVLTLGTYPRLPWNIKDRFVSTPPLAGREQRLTLRQLNHVLEFHLAQNARQLSPRIEQIYIKNGTVTLTVPNEFEIVLTRLGDDVQLTKWCLLNLKILVSNADVGNGQKLVHPLQLNFLHQLVQERLDNGEKVRKLNDNQCLPLTNKLTTIPADRSIFQFIREDQFYLIIAFTPDDQIGIKIQFYLFSSAEGRLTMLDLDAEQIIRSAPLPRLYASSLIALNSKHVSSTQEKQQKY
ncbi:Mediator of RNA polymerase II transcription subunit 14 [Meloidogyne graminicola]|uniref:Mediator of RNA polymerase II transcription subunit 14 n=1 Tax=Meloidogyne graminicola TaxID=189291 RepID=A0A8S9ZSG7_9BILA|nr:Mediator of RNA polymerase II transcription subunit 14 [Meloidogyne graminicola]